MFNMRLLVIFILSLMPLSMYAAAAAEILVESQEFRGRGNPIIRRALVTPQDTLGTFLNRTGQEYSPDKRYNVTFKKGRGRYEIFGTDARPHTLLWPAIEEALREGGTVVISIKPKPIVKQIIRPHFDPERTESASEDERDADRGGGASASE